MVVVKIYADEGKSGLNAEGREQFRKLLIDVQGHHAAYRGILVYDVSRWGRFQDADESAYYEYICRRAGIQVAYCAEQFENDGSPVSTIVKASSARWRANTAASCRRRCSPGSAA